MRSGGTSSPTFLGDVVHSMVLVAGGNIQLTLADGHILSLNPQAWPDFSHELQTGTQWFTGRGFVFKEIQNFVQTQPCGYFRIVADAGLGKTAICAELAKRYRAPVYFLSMAEGRTDPSAVLNTLAAQVIARYNLPHAFVPADAGVNSDWLRLRLHEAATRRGSQPVLIVIDALDEADSVRPGRNWLHLPKDLPAGVYIVVTHRPGDYQLHTSPGVPVEELEIRAQSKQQADDVEGFLRSQVRRRGILEAWQRRVRNATVEEFVSTYRDASENNFMYLRYALADLVSGLAERQHVTQMLPRGLAGYYRQIWAGMEESVRLAEGAQVWTDLCKPVIEYLAEAREPVTEYWLADHLRERPDEIRNRALMRWRRFLRRDRDHGQPTWRVVHHSFRDFLTLRQDDLGVNPTAVHKSIAAYYWNDTKRWAEHGGYGQRHLSWHLQECDDSEILFTVVDSWYWYLSQLDADPSGSLFLADVTRAWEASEKANQHAIAFRRTIPYLYREVRAALTVASLRSVSMAVPPAVLVALVQYGLWSLDVAIASCRLNPVPKSRRESLAALAPLVRDVTKRELLKDEIMSLADEGVTEHPPAEAEIPSNSAQTVAEAVSHAAACSDDQSRVAALIQIIPVLGAAGYLRVALMLIRSVGPKYAYRRAEGLALLSRFAELRTAREMASEALSTARFIFDSPDETFAALRGRHVVRLPWQQRDADLPSELARMLSAVRSLLGSGKAIALLRALLLDIPISVVMLIAIVVIGVRLTFDSWEWPVLFAVFVLIRISASVVTVNALRLEVGRGDLRWQDFAAGAYGRFKQAKLPRPSSLAAVIDLLLSLDLVLRTMLVSMADSFFWFIEWLLDIEALSRPVWPRRLLALSIGLMLFGQALIVLGVYFRTTSAGLGLIISTCGGTVLALLLSRVLRSRMREEATLTRKITTWTYEEFAELQREISVNTRP